MGRKSWRVQEEHFLEGLVKTDEGRAVVARAKADKREHWWKDAVGWFTKKYIQEFSYCFDEETAEELAERQKRQPRAKLDLFPAESEGDMKERLQHITKVSEV